MKVSAKTRYAARILLALAGVYDSRATSLCDGKGDVLCTGVTSEIDTHFIAKLPKPLPMNSHAVAEKTGVTVQFTEQILKALKHGGLTVSTRGAAGGYSLTRAPNLITLGEVMRVMEGGVQLASCVTSGRNADEQDMCERAHNCVMRNAWTHVTKALEDTLDGISLADLLMMDRDL